MERRHQEDRDQDQLEQVARMSHKRVHARLRRAMAISGLCPPKPTSYSFSRYPPRCIDVGRDLAPNDVDVTAQIIQLV